MWKKVLVGLVAAAIGLCLRGMPGSPDVDSFSYQAMAEGRMQEVVQPYAKRVLHPLVVRWVGGSFEVVAVVTLIAFFIALTKLLGAFDNGFEREKIVSDPHKEMLQLFCLVCAPFFCSYIVEIYLSDLFVMTLTAWFFVFLHKERMGWCLLMLFLMQISRESTAVVVFAFLSVALVRLQWKLAVCIVGVFACALIVVSFVSRESLGNIHSMGGFVYMVTKVAASALVNLCGLTVWSDTYALALPHYYPNPPLWQMPVPSWLPLGGTKMMGVYTVDVWRPFEVLVVLTSSFGLLPVVLLKQVKSHVRVKNIKWVACEEIPYSVIVAFMVGVAFCLLSPFSGRTILRYVGYAWPLFWFALIYLTKGNLFEKKILWVFHLACMWWPVFLARSSLQREVTCLLGGIGTIVFLWAGTKYIFPQKDGSEFSTLKT